MSEERDPAGTAQQWIADLLAGLGGRTAIAAHRIGGRTPAATGNESSVRLRADDVFQAASLSGLPIAVEVLRRADLGQFRLADRIDLAPRPQIDDDAPDEAVADGELSVGDLCARMLVYNDATAANTLLEFVGVGEINETLSRLKLERTRLARQFTDAGGHSVRRENQTSADDMLTLLTLLHGRALPGSQRLLAMLASRPANLGTEGGWALVEAHRSSRGAHDGLVHRAGVLTGPSGACAYCILMAEQPDVVAAQTVIGDVLRLLGTRWRLG